MYLKWDQVLDNMPLFFSQQFINWQWQPSDLINNHPGIIEWTSELANVAKPLHYEIGQTSLPNFNADVIYTANTFHIVSKELVEKFILEIGQWVQPDTWLIIYGPFNYEGRFTSESNEKFNKFLIETYPGGGIKHFEDILKMLTQQNFKLIEDADMPANNRCLVLRKSSQ